MATPAAPIPASSTARTVGGRAVRSITDMRLSGTTFVGSVGEDLRRRGDERERRVGRDRDRDRRADHAGRRVDLGDHGRRVGLEVDQRHGVGRRVRHDRVITPLTSRALWSLADTAIWAVAGTAKRGCQEACGEWGRDASSSPSVRVVGRRRFYALIRLSRSRAARPAGAARRRASRRCAAYTISCASPRASIIRPTRQSRSVGTGSPDRYRVRATRAASEKSAPLAEPLGEQLDQIARAVEVLEVEVAHRARADDQDRPVGMRARARGRSTARPLSSAAA